MPAGIGNDFRGPAVECFRVVNLRHVRRQVKAAATKESWKRCERWIRATAFENAVGFVVFLESA
jgi:hypothetical protein